jgi:hypothetical protein
MQLNAAQFAQNVIGDCRDLIAATSAAASSA